MLGEGGGKSLAMGERMNDAIQQIRLHVLYLADNKSILAEVGRYLCISKLKRLSTILGRINQSVERAINR